MDWLVFGIIFFNIFFNFEKNRVTFFKKQCKIILTYCLNIDILLFFI